MAIQLTRTHSIDEQTSPYVIAEIGSNHNGDMDLARKHIAAARSCGAHAAKFQSFSSESLIAREEYEKNTSYGDKKKHFGSLREMVDAYQLTPDQHRQVHEMCIENSIDFISTPFCRNEVDLLCELEVPFLKVASMDVNHLRFLKYVAATGKPVVLSTGMASLGEIERAIMTIEAEGNTQIVLLHCIAIYPPDLADIHLNNIPMLERTFGYPVGFSDHSIGVHIPLAATALGACVIEKHFTLDKNMPGWDHEISADPDELREICNGADSIHRALGTRRRVVSPAEMEKRKKFRRSAVTVRDLPAGTCLSAEDIEYKRPGTGFAPDLEDQLVGRRLARDLNADDVIRPEDLA